MSNLDDRLKQFLDLEENKRKSGYTNEKILKTVQRLADDMSELQQTTISHGQRIMNLEARMATLKPTPTPRGVRSVPPMRPPTDSSLDLMEKARSQVSSEYSRLARETEGPSGVVQATPDKLTAIAEKAVKVALEERRQRDDTLRLQAYDDAIKDRRKWMIRLASAFVMAIVGAAGTWTWGKAAGHVEGHDSGVIEGRNSVKGPGGIGVQVPAAAATVMLPEVEAAPAAKGKK
jgi:hypothetical protein